MDLVTSAMTTYIDFINHTIIDPDPFTHVVLKSYPQPIDLPYPYFRYWITIGLLAPLFLNGFSLLISVYTGEWWKIESFRREAWMSSRTLVLLSPMIAWIFKNLFEGNVGKLYYQDPTFTLDYIGYQVLSVAVYFFVADTVFYFSHKFWHNDWLYNHSHYYHHTCRPTNSWAGNAADVFEVFLTGFSSAVLAGFLFPMEARTFLMSNIFTQFWSIYLHNHEGHQMPKWISDCRNHTIHHLYGQKNYNFGLYFEFWDRCLGTFKADAPIERLRSNKDK
eukprot:TRINITY_DN12066_c0_g1_i1.p1 TRINITY_DN12066_c0_g1~~TRINITY_DN12066_c0_g1_i1.p1  ORF type:complete len:277 (-),score=16.79 TRINITY_DN12066_c0_g1_i1:17-847(-)